MISNGRIVVPVLFLVLMLGCSKGDNRSANASISGDVTYKSKPVKGGSITFHPATGPGYTSILGADGTYSITDVPPGEMAVTIETESVAGKGQKAEKEYGEGGKYKGSPRPDYAKGNTPVEVEYTKIPEKYSNKNKSPLSVTLKPGRNVNSFELTD